MNRHDVLNGKCPTTGKPFNWTWTDHSRAGVYNSCVNCNETKHQGVGDLLRETAAKRKRK